MTHNNSSEVALHSGIERVDQVKEVQQKTPWKYQLMIKIYPERSWLEFTLKIFIDGKKNYFSSWKYWSIINFKAASVPQSWQEFTQANLRWQIEILDKDKDSQKDNV